MHNASLAPSCAAPVDCRIVDVREPTLIRPWVRIIYLLNKMITLILKRNLWIRMNEKCKVFKGYLTIIVSYTYFRIHSHEIDNSILSKGTRLDALKWFSSWIFDPTLLWEKKDKWSKVLYVILLEIERHRCILDIVPDEEPSLDRIAVSRDFCSCIS